MEPSFLPAPARDWSSALQHHREAAAAVIATASQVREADWDRPVAPGKWSPAQIVEHLRLTTAALRHEIETGDGLRVRTSWWRRHLFRVLFLRRILRTGEFPAGARAVREIQPGSGPFDQRATTDALAAELRRFELAFEARRDAVLTHPIFGAADASTGLRFCVVHLWHHRVQIASGQSANRE